MTQGQATREAAARERPLRIERQQGMLRLVAVDDIGQEYACCHLMGSMVVGHHVLERRALLFAQAPRLRRLVGTLAAMVEAQPPPDAPEVFEALAEARELLRETE